jgi:protein Mpv17
MVAQCGTAAVLFGSGDVIAQQMIEKKGLKGHDVRALFLPLFYHPLGYFLGIILINS